MYYEVHGSGESLPPVGEILELALYSKLAHTQIYDPGNMGRSMGAEPYIVTVTFNEADGMTNVTTSIKFASQPIATRRCRHA